jgi:hypothetical protein
VDGSRSHPSSGSRASTITLRLSFALSYNHGTDMIADSNSNIAWHRVQLKKNRATLKAMEIARFRIGEMTGPTGQAQRQAITNLKRKIAESERCIAAYERRTKRPLATDLQSLARVSWSKWNDASLSR